MNYQEALDNKIQAAIDIAVQSSDPKMLTSYGELLSTKIEAVAEARSVVAYRIYQKHRDEGMSAGEARTATANEVGVSATRLLKIVERGSAIHREWAEKGYGIE